MSKTFNSKRTGCLTVPKCHFFITSYPLVYGMYFAKNAFPPIPFNDPSFSFLPRLAQIPHLLYDLFSTQPSSCVWIYIGLVRLYCSRTCLAYGLEGLFFLKWGWEGPYKLRHSSIFWYFSQSSFSANSAELIKQQKIKALSKWTALCFPLTTQRELSRTNTLRCSLGFNPRSVCPEWWFSIIFIFPFLLRILW